MVGRRHWLQAAVLLVLAPALAEAAGMSRVTAYAFTFKGDDARLIAAIGQELAAE